MELDLRVEDDDTVTWVCPVPECGYEEPTRPGAGPLGARVVAARREMAQHVKVEHGDPPYGGSDMPSLLDDFATP